MIFGLDLSLTSTGISWEQETQTISTKLKGAKRLRWIAAEIVRIIDQEAKDGWAHVVLEGYSFAHKQTRAHALGELGGVVKVAFLDNRIDYSIVPPTVRAKFATGKGNAAKSAVVSAVSARTGLVFEGAGADDQCDAWILAEMGRIYLKDEGQFEWPKINLEALEKAEWNASSAE
jgi:Holliday junction resolvasome RuvABC endonuclease subunit